MPEPAPPRRSDSPPASENQNRTSAQYAHRRLDDFVHDAENPPPATPPYRRIATASTHDVSLSASAYPPDYRSEYNVSRDHLYEASSSRANLAQPMSDSDWPREKEKHHLAHHDTDDEKSQYATAATGREGKTVHYPDTDGLGQLHNATPRSQRFTDVPLPPRPMPSRSNSLAGSDIDDDEDEVYDWSDEEDLVDQEAKFEKVMGKGDKKRRFGFFRFLTFFFSTLVGSTVLAGALVAAGILLRKFWLQPHRDEHRAYVTDIVEAWLFWAAANVMVSWWLASIIDVLPHIFTFLVVIVWGTVSERLKSRIELYQTGKGWVKPLFYAACSWVSWVILFEGVFKLYDGKDESQSRAQWTIRVYQVIRFLFFLTLAVCLEKMLVQMIAFSFHQTAYKERLDAVTTATKVLDHLKDYKPKRRTPGGSGTQTPLLLRSSLFNAFGTNTTVVAEPGSLEEGSSHNSPRAVGGYGADSEDNAHGTGSPRGIATPPKKKGIFGFGGGASKSSRGRQPRRQDSNIPLQDSPTHTHGYPPARNAPTSASPSGRSTPGGSGGRRTPGGGPRPSHETEHEAVLMQAAKALKTVAMHDSRGMRKAVHGEHDEGASIGWNLNGAHEAKKLARNLYYAFRSDRKRKYLIPSDFYPAYRTPEEAREAFRVFDKDDNGDITKAEIKTAVLKVYKERRFLARSLRDVSAAVNTLDTLMLAIFLIILIFIALPIFGVSISSSFTSIYPVFISASFIFKNAASNAFDSIMFLFVTHPFDTGDRVFIDDENLVVRKMGLFATTFTRVDGSLTYYFNTMLVNKFILNARRSANMAENLEMQVSWKTPTWKLEALEKRVNEWIDSDEKRWFKPGTSINFSKIDFQRALYLTIGIGHNGTWQDWTMRLARKTAFHAAVQYYCRQLDIAYSESPQPVIFPDSGVDERIGEEAPVTPVTPTPATPYAPAQPSLLEGPRTMLGFTPPQGKNELRQRKSNRKKLMGAGEADG